ncbi:hypothetical protein ACEU6E_10920 (plasmid) [Halorutilales archaeon Cl-col2-1]
MSVANQSSPTSEKDIEALIDEKVEEKVSGIEERLSQLEEGYSQLKNEVEEVKADVESVEKNVETEIEKSLDLVEHLREEVSEIQENGVSTDKTEDVPYDIEKYSRDENLRQELSENKRRAVNLWKEAPRFGKDVGEKYVFNPKELAKFLHHKEGIPLEKAKEYRQTHKRIREYAEDLGEGLIQKVDRGKTAGYSEKKRELKGSYRLEIKKEAWSTIRTDSAVRRILGE